MFILFNDKFKFFIKKNIYLFFILNFFFKILPHFIKKLLLPHEYDYFILKKIKSNKKVKILDIGGGYGESIISFYKISKNIEIDTYEPNFINFKQCLKLMKIYPSLNVLNYAYGNSSKIKTLFIPKFHHLYFDNFSGFDVSTIKKNFKKNFNTDKIKFLKQRIKFKTTKKKFDLIKIDCETNFYNVIKNLSSNIKKKTVFMIENNKDSKKIYLFLKKINSKYKCYYFLNSRLIRYDFSSSSKNNKILNLIFKV